MINTPTNSFGKYNRSSSAKNNRDRHCFASFHSHKNSIMFESRVENVVKENKGRFKLYVSFNI